MRYVNHSRKSIFTELYESKNVFESAVTKYIGMDCKRLTLLSGSVKKQNFILCIPLLLSSVFLVVETVVLGDRAKIIS